MIGPREVAGVASAAVRPRQGPDLQTTANCLAIGAATLDDAAAIGYADGQKDAGCGDTKSFEIQHI